MSKRTVLVAAVVLVTSGAVAGCSSSPVETEGEAPGRTTEAETVVREPPPPPLNPRAPLSQDEIDLVNRILAGQPDRLRMLSEPVSELAVPTPDGNFTIDVPNREGRLIKRTTMGNWFNYRSIIAASRRLQTHDNRVALYGALRSGTTVRDPSLPTLDQARMLSNDALDAIIDNLVAVATAPHDIALVPPPPPPHACDVESGTGKGTDSKLNCQPQSQYLKNVTFPLKNDLSCIRDQGNRGTCSSFAITGAVETAWRVKHTGNFLNLSEQGLYARATHAWNNTDYGDGLAEVDTLERMVSLSYRFPWEASWDYNPSSNRTDSGSSYAHSCDNYAEKCSNTTHQLPASNGTWVDTTSASSGVGVSSYVEIDLALIKSPIATATALLAQKIPIVLSFMADGTFQHPDANAYVQWYSTELIGAHAAMLVGTVTVGELKAFGAAPPPYEYEPDWYRLFIVRNSWGCEWGDSGYAFVHAEWIRARAVSMTAVISN